MRVKKRLYVTMWEGVPDAWFQDRRALVQRLEELTLDDAERMQVFAVFNERGPGQDITKHIALLVSKLYDFAGGDEPDDYLRHFPPFVLEHCRADLVATFNSAADPNSVEIPSFLPRRGRSPSLNQVLSEEWAALDRERRP